MFRLFIIIAFLFNPLPSRVNKLPLLCAGYERHDIVGETKDKTSLAAFAVIEILTSFEVAVVILLKQISKMK